jgi:hypothetical protein
MAIKRKSVAKIGRTKRRSEIILTEENPTLAGLFHYGNWLCKLNELNTSLQGETANILLLHNKITAFVKKISIGKQKVVN